ncbi:Carboxylesterase 5A [Mactra antiquata]
MRICLICIVSLVGELYCLDIRQVSPSSTVIVSTSNGDVRGHVLNLNGSNVVGSNISSVNMFLGIPYAEAPLGKLRFSEPLSRSSWSPNVLNALDFSSSCQQRPFFLRSYSFSSTYNDFSEDCLYLNIYTPHNSDNPDVLYPVLFWIHGGSYQFGSGGEYDGRILAQQGIIVVTVNYRLGALGFLSTDDDVARGNYGLLDQWLALTWVKENIDRFHGDRDKITISGQSAGGGSTSLHMFSPLSEGLFNSMILQSGCALSPWSIYRPPHTVRTQTEALATTLGCTTSDSVAMVNCLRNVDANKLVNAQITAPPMISIFAPRVDGHFIHDLPEKLLEQGQYSRVNILNGFVPDEVAEDYESIPGIDYGLRKQQIDDLFYSKSRRFLTNADDMYRALKCVYPLSDTDIKLNREHFIDMASDYGYVSPHIKLSEKLSADGMDVWLYEFMYRSANTLKKPWIGVPHAEDLYYMFGAPFLNQSPCPADRNVTCPVTWGNYQPWSNEDKQVSKNIMKLWADFVKLGHNSNLFTSTRNLPGFMPGENLIKLNSTIYVEHLVKTKGLYFWGSFNYLNLTQPIPDVCSTYSGIPVGK